MDSVIHYKHIEEVKQRIPEMFYLALLGELISIFGRNYYLSLSDDLETVYDFDSGTAGWAAAVYMTCKKLDMMWLFEEWSQLPWYDSDTLDGQIEEELTKIINDDSITAGANSYYKYLISKMDSHQLIQQEG